MGNCPLFERNMKLCLIYLIGGQASKKGAALTGMISKYTIKRRILEYSIPMI
jgi:hypothetical protein